ncbi:hypothetical protein GW17_00033435 [Ensete ventricosum]|uniref:Uncharacterized protein n=1 Tax=Ensete ventricosum TaxID=4639 RepID=A0A444DZ42_ENSVE|nr:hypothetical protein GW17_00033435 [Ensete ventricosum]RZR75058.1 hypothetical protein BHM03_00048696 [Ensete ventricosum]
MGTETVISSAKVLNAARRLRLRHLGVYHVTNVLCYICVSVRANPCAVLLQVIRTSGRKLGEKQPKTGPPSPIKNRGRSSYWSPEGVSDRPPPAPDHPGSSAVGYAFHPDLVESNM